MTKKKPPPPEPAQPVPANQDALDLEDAQSRLSAMARAVIAQREADDEVRRISQELTQAKRRQKEARWNLANVLRREENRIKPPGLFSSE
jgi:DNA invertase Pin-like site-specific DNA recombinase